MSLFLVVFSLFLGSSGEPKDAQSWFLLAWRSFEKQEWEEARVAATRALSINPRLGDAEVLLGLVSTAQQKFDEAEKHFLSAVSLQPRSHLAQGYLASIYLRQKRYAEAREGFGKVLRIHPLSNSARYNLGVIALAQGKPAEALDYFKAASALDPSDVEARIGILESQVVLNQEAQILPSLRSIEPLLKPRDPRLFQVATMLALHQRYTYAIPIFERVQKASPRSYDVTYNVALAYLGSGNYDKAAEAVNSLLDRQPRAEVHNLVGLVAEKRQHQVEAEHAFRRAAELEPTNEDYRMDYANNVLQHKSTERAIDEFARGVRDFPGSWRMQLGLGSAFYLAGKYDESVLSLLEATRRNPDSKLPYFVLGKAYEFAGSTQANIIEAFESYLNKNPQDPWAFYHYGTISFLRSQTHRKPDFSVAKTNLDRAIALNEGFAEAHLQLGIIAEREGLVERAIRSFLRAIELQPKLAPAHYRLALAYQRLGDKAKAQTEFDLFERLKSESPADRERQQMVQALAEKPK